MKLKSLLPTLDQILSGRWAASPTKGISPVLRAPGNTYAVPQHQTALASNMGAWHHSQSSQQTGSGTPVAEALSSEPVVSGLLQLLQSWEGIERQVLQCIWLSACAVGTQAMSDAV